MVEINRQKPSSLQTAIKQYENILIRLEIERSIHWTHYAICSVCTHANFQLFKLWKRRSWPQTIEFLIETMPLIIIYEQMIQAINQIKLAMRRSWIWNTFELKQYSHSCFAECATCKLGKCKFDATANLLLHTNCCAWKAPTQMLDIFSLYAFACMEIESFHIIFWSNDIDCKSTLFTNSNRSWQRMKLPIWETKTIYVKMACFIASNFLLPLNQSFCTCLIELTSNFILFVCLRNISIKLNTRCISMRFSAYDGLDLLLLDIKWYFTIPLYNQFSFGPFQLANSHCDSIAT